MVSLEISLSPSPFFPPFSFFGLACFFVVNLGGSFEFQMYIKEANSTIFYECRYLERRTLRSNQELDFDLSFLFNFEIDRIVDTDSKSTLSSTE